MNILDLGWNSDLQNHFTPYESQGFTVGRVVKEHKRIYRVMTNQGEILAELSGKIRFESSRRVELPAVGDWVVLKASGGHALVHAILPRKSKFSRKVAGTVTEEQLIATNIDTVFLVNALNQDFNLRRMERYLLLTWESGATPVIVLSKADLCENIEQKLSEIRSIAYEVPICTISATTNQGLDSLASYLTKGQTIALIGSSGVGKSTLVNTLAGQEIQQVNEIRTEDGRGKHTTTYRELILLPNGAVLMDTPGMRELQLPATDEGLQSTFHDIELLASQCFFQDCKHQGEPRCAVKIALEEGTLDPNRFHSFQKLEKELAYIEQKEKEKNRKTTKKQKRPKM